MIALLALLATAPPPDSTRPRAIHELIHTIWTPKNGGGPAGIRDLAQTTDGYIWIGTFSDGLIRFDGVQFVHYKPLGGDSLPGGPVNRLLATRDGSLWIVGSGGIVIHLKAGRATTYGAPDSLPSVNNLAESQQGDLVAATIKGPFRFSDGKWQPMREAWGFHWKECRTVWFDRHDALWSVTEDSVVYLPSGGKQFVTTGFAYPAPSLMTRFVEQGDGTIWMSETAHSVHTVNTRGDTLTDYSDIHVEPSAMLIDHLGSLWLTTIGNGLRRVPDLTRIHGLRLTRHAPEVEEFTMKDGLLTDLPNALMEDRSGNIWVGSTAGLERFRVGAFTPVLANTPGRARFVMADGDSNVWTGAYNHGAIQRFGPDGTDSILGPGVFDIAFDSLKRVWLADGDNLMYIAGKKLVTVKLRPPVPEGIGAVAIDPQQKVWVWTQGKGFMRLDGDSLIQIDPLEEPTYHFGFPYSDSKGRIWVAQRKRVALYDHGKLTKYEPAQGIDGMAYGFWEDRAGTIWAMTGRGLARYEGDHFRTVGEKLGIPRASVYGAAQDESGAWWLSTTPGILRVPPGEIDKVLADSTYQIHYQVFDELDGMLGTLVKSYWGPVLTRSSDGKIWVATDSGLAWIDPRTVPAPVPPPVNIEVGRAQGVEMAATDGAEIPAGTNDLEIDYTSLTFATPERVRFRYQLEGEDKSWREVGTRRRAYYTGLAPGTYRFKVSARFGDGSWNDAGAAWSFRVLPTWYQTLWFKALVVLAIAGLSGAAVALVQRRRHERVELGLRDKYEATLAERARIAQDLHDTLLQGFAGVTLQLKAVEVALPKEAGAVAETLKQVRELARESLREARERVWEMRDSALTAEDLPSALEGIARDRTGGTGIDFTIQVSGRRRRFAPGQEDAAFRIGREAIANAVKHADADRIEILIGFGEKELTLEVRDNGRGFTDDQGDKARREGHFGLSGMRDRAGQAGGRCEIKSGDAGGTVVLLELPLTEVVSRT